MNDYHRSTKTRRAEPKKKKDEEEDAAEEAFRSRNKIITVQGRHQGAEPPGGPISRWAEPSDVGSGRRIDPDRTDQDGKTSIGPVSIFAV